MSSGRCDLIHYPKSRHGKRHQHIRRQNTDRGHPQPSLPGAKVQPRENSADDRSYPEHYRRNKAQQRENDRADRLAEV